MTDTTIPEFLTGGGEMGARIREYDWSKTSLGPVQTWPKSLQTCLRIMLTSRQPIWIGWGKELIKFYNDPYIAIVGGKHPRALGQPASVVWKDIWNDIEAMLKSVMEEDEGFYVEEQLLIMERNGYPEETYYTFSYTPIPGDDGGTAGMICANTDDTDRIKSERQLKTITTLGKVLYDIRSEDDVFYKALESFHDNPYDFPFAVFYKTASGNTHSDAPAVVYGDLITSELRSLPNNNEFLRAVRQAALQKKQHLITDAEEKIGKLPCGPWHKHPHQALVLPIFQRGQKEATVFLLVALNPYRPLDEKYSGFLDLIADQISISLSKVHALAEEQTRLEALAEIDRAKTTFFSNISHEFRTPLTLLLGPIQDALDEPHATQENARRLEVALRNAHRMQKLVNMLLDFSRIEAGKMEAQFSAVDLSAITEDLTSTFRTAIEKAGMKLDTNFEKLSAAVYVDTEMWEKIVLNLLSNALKYSTKGTITVSLGESAGSVILKVSDTGSGIHENQLEKIFERFHRVQNVRGRSQEGTGIGLALIKELVKLHHGTIQVESKLNEGSTFSVFIPTGKNHLQSGQITTETAGHQSGLSHIFIEEADQWNEDTLIKTVSDNPPKLTSPFPTVVLADDNHDMQNYIRRLLSSEYHVIATTNGLDAFKEIVNRKPDLVISDIMMPGLDGFGLLKLIRDQPEVKNTPVIFLSARAGEESKVEGLKAGADDYLIKPFSSRELLAKVSSLIKATQLRVQSETQIRNLFNLAPVAITILKGENFVVELANEFYLSIVNKDNTFIGKPLFDSLPELKGQGLDELLNGVISTGKPYVGKELPLQMRRYGEPETVYFNFVYHPLFENDVVTGVIAVANEVSELVLSRELARESANLLERKVAERTLELLEQKEFVETILQSSVDLMLVFDRDLNVMSVNKNVEQVYGMKKENVIGKSVRQLFPNLTPADFANISRALDGETVHNKTFRSGNVNKYFESYLIPLRTSDNQVYGVLSTAHDITDIITASEEIRRTAEQLEIVNKQLIEKNTELEQFAYISSHDLQEPLRKIQTFTELVKENIEDEVYVKNYLGKIDASAARMSALIKDVLQYSRLSNAERKFEAVDLNATLEEVRTDFELMITEKSAVIKSDTLPTLTGSERQFHQLFSNLLSNALKFCDNKPVIQIRYAFTKGEDVPPGMIDRSLTYAKISVVDNGVGFDPQYADKIFGLFSRLQNRKDYSGTGIGLALCRKIVENHNGMMVASSEKGKGATFDVYLPQYRKHAPTG